MRTTTNEVCIVCNILLTALCAQGQTAEQSTTRLLTSPSLKANAEIVQNNPPGSSLEAALTTAKDAAPSRGIAWKGLEFTSYDALGVLVDVTDAVLLDIFKKRTCLADAIVVGHATLGMSHLSHYGTAVYTDYAFVVDALLKNNSKASIRESPIVITRRGGSVELAAGPLKHYSQEFPTLQFGSTYLQFLRFIPESSSYHSIDGFSTLIAKDETWSLVRIAASGRTLRELRRGAFEAIISEWLKSCE